MHGRLEQNRIPFLVPGGVDQTIEADMEYYLLVKALSRDRCSIVWVYSKTYRRLVRITEENYANLFEYHSMKVSGAKGPPTQSEFYPVNDRGQLLDLLTTLPASNDKQEVEQILLYSELQNIDEYFPSFQLISCSKPIKEEENQVSNEFQYFQEHKKMKIILVFIRYPISTPCKKQQECDLCTLSKEWLQRDRLIRRTVDYSSPLNIFRPTFDLIRSL